MLNCDFLSFESLACERNFITSTKMQTVGSGVGLSESNVCGLKWGGGKSNLTREQSSRLQTTLVRNNPAVIELGPRTRLLCTHQSVERRSSSPEASARTPRGKTAAPTPPRPPHYDFNFASKSNKNHWTTNHKAWELHAASLVTLKGKARRCDQAVVPREMPERGAAVGMMLRDR